MADSKTFRKLSDDDLLYPPIEPFQTGKLPVSKIHTIYYEQCGNKDGIPIVFVHGYACLQEASQHFNRFAELPHSIKK